MPVTMLLGFFSGKFFVKYIVRFDSNENSEI